jgi:ring-1,2-phenylacetyl-CoA epoxidase subunit PaaC
MTKQISNSHFINYILHLADNALVLGHRNSEWTGHGPILEQDIALSNISLDLIGQARNLYQYAAVLINKLNDHSTESVTEDTLAYLRDADEYRNCLLVEQENGDWGKTITRQFLFSNYQFFLFKQLRLIDDEQVNAIAEKSLKEITYHLRWSSEWMIRLGDGTHESNRRMQDAINNLWIYTEELFIPSAYEAAVLQAAGISLEEIKRSWMENVVKVIQEATLMIPKQTTTAVGGKDGKHSPALTALLNEMQHLQRTYPGANW